ncbi:MAG: hypothetical protein WDM89_02785 [Rhizomicrobium sp.]
MMCLANPAQCADRRTEIHVISRHQQSAAVPAKAGDRLAILRRQAIPHIYSKKPHLIETAVVER